jgi:uroporphyrinogen-III synthase
MTDNLPLAGLNIVVTRPREQALHLAQAIKKLGGSCILFPLLEISPLADDLPLRNVISRLAEFQLLIFISPNAVQHGMAAILAKGNLPASIAVATVGLSSAKALHDFGVTKVIAPQLRFDSEALLELPEMQNVRGKKILIFRGDSGRELLGDTLKFRGATVEYVTCYHRSKPQHDVTALLSARPDILSVSSSEALNNLWQMLNAAEKVRLLALPLFVTHARIADVAHRLGWQQVITVAGGDDALLSELSAWATHRKGRE